MSDKIQLTSLLFTGISWGIIYLASDENVPDWLKVLLLAVFFGSMLTAIVSTLIRIWA